MVYLSQYIIRLIQLFVSKLVILCNKNIEFDTLYGIRTK